VGREEGLTLGGKEDVHCTVVTVLRFLTAIFKSFCRQVGAMAMLWSHATGGIVQLDHLLFCHQKIEPDDVVRALFPLYLQEDVSNHSGLINYQHCLLTSRNESDDQKLIMEGILVDVLQDSSYDFLKDFIWVCNRISMHAKIELQNCIGVQL
jgi:uncharacterized protein YdeI (BOF family)